MGEEKVQPLLESIAGLAQQMPLQGERLASMDDQRREDTAVL